MHVNMNLALEMRGASVAVGKETYPGFISTRFISNSACLLTNCKTNEKNTDSFEILPMFS